MGRQVLRGGVHACEDGRGGRDGSGPLLGMAVDVQLRRGAWLAGVLVAAGHTREQ